jgi:hypothetical protein
MDQKRERKHKIIFGPKQNKKIEKSPNQHAQMGQHTPGTEPRPSQEPTGRSRAEGTAPQAGRALATAARAHLQPVGPSQHAQVGCDVCCLIQYT